MAAERRGERGEVAGLAGIEADDEADYPNHAQCGSNTSAVSVVSTTGPTLPSRSDESIVQRTTAATIEVGAVLNRRVLVGSRLAKGEISPDPPTANSGKHPIVGIDGPAVVGGGAKGGVRPPERDDVAWRGRDDGGSASHATPSQVRQAFEEQCNSVALTTTGIVGHHGGKLSPSRPESGRGVAGGSGRGTRSNAGLPEISPMPDSQRLSAPNSPNRRFRTAINLNWARLVASRKANPPYSKSVDVAVDDQVKIIYGSLVMFVDRSRNRCAALYPTFFSCTWFLALDTIWDRMLVASLPACRLADSTRIKCVLLH